MPHLPDHPMYWGCGGVGCQWWPSVALLPVYAVGGYVQFPTLSLG